ncbi:MAG: hypothetical protein V4772_22165 [Pseudomonadota bacterium]
MTKIAPFFGFLLIVGLLAQAQPLDQDFDNRFAQGKKNQTTAQGAAYLAALTPLFRRVGKKCALGVKVEGRESLELVADVDESLKMTNVQVHPSTSRTSCFAASLEAQPVPNPPTLPFVVSTRVMLTE